ncbi:MAG: copper chaperone PCu(A)C [Qipengyuania sp.]
MNKSICAAALLAGASIALGGCDSGEETAGSEANAGLAGLEVQNARLALPAVSGNPAAIYFDLVNTSDKNYAIRKAEVKGAGKTEVHGSMEWSGEMTMGETGPQTVQAGETLKFEPDGLHVMVFDLSPDLQSGGTTEMTLTVAGGKTATFPVTIQAAGEDR